MCVFITAASCFPACHSHGTGRWWWSVDSVKPHRVGLEIDRQTLSQSMSEWVRISYSARSLIQWLNCGWLEEVLLKS